jgi:NADH dehydrogenase [ubiquinone] 1 alpha subcomplex assembly factor 7
VSAGTTELGRLIARRIALTGPITIAEFMAEALLHPTLGYYRRAPVVGRAGDFITAPEISQMFGELIGAWLAERWQSIGRPAPVRLVELGPGRGTLLSDALRATRDVPGFPAAIDLHLVESNARLREQQRQTIGAYQPHWHERLDDVPQGPLLLVANEFFDALPVRQFHKTSRGWHERMVGLTADGERLAFALAPGATPFAPLLPQAADGAEAELCEAARAIAAEIGRRTRQDGGWVLIVDYGYDRGHFASLQAVRSHRGAGILDRPGETDLTIHVDFAALAASAGLRSFGPVSQAEFLARLGIARRAEILKGRASAEQRQVIDAAVERLIAPDQMGTLFRVLAMGDDRSAAPAGFADSLADRT